MAGKESTAVAGRTRPAPAVVMERSLDDPFLPELRQRTEALAARLR